MAKILLLSPKDNNFYNFRSELILSLKERGHEVVLVCPYGKKIDYFTNRGCRFINLDLQRRGTNIFADLKLLLQYYKIIKREKPNIVLTYTTKSSTYGGLACRMAGIPYIINNAGMYRKEDFNKIIWFVLKSLYKLSYANANCLMYQNSYERDTLNKIIKHKARFREIPGSGVNLKDFAYTNYPIDDEKIIINYVARIVKIKGIDELLECAHIIHKNHKNVVFVIYGDYDDEIYKEKIKKAEQSGEIKYGGIQMDMKPYIKKCHAVIHPSYYEGMTNVVLEHSASGRPCLGSNIPGVKDGIEDGKTGFLFNVQDVPSMVEAVEKFLSLTHQEKEAMGIEAHKKMVKEFDRDIVTNIYLEEINNILNHLPNKIVEDDRDI